MVSINKTLNFVVKQGEKLTESYIIKKANVTNFKGLKYTPQHLSEDVVQIAEKSSEGANTEIDIEKLKILADKNLTLNEIASELKLKPSIIRFQMQKYNIATDKQEKIRAIRRYFSAKTPKDKAKAFEKVDEYLKQIAQKAFEQKKGPTYEDCLQDARLRFFEILDNAQQRNVQPSGIFNKISQYKPAEDIIETETLENNIPATNTLIDTFEGTDFQTQFLKHFRSQQPHKISTIFEAHLIGDKTIYEIAKAIGLELKRVEQLLENRIRDNAEILLKKMISPERIQSRASYKHKLTKEIIAMENSRNLCKLKNSNYYFKELP